MAMVFSAHLQGWADPPPQLCKIGNYNKKVERKNLHGEVGQTINETTMCSGERRHGRHSAPGAPVPRRQRARDPNQISSRTFLYMLYKIYINYSNLFSSCRKILYDGKVVEHLYKLQQLFSSCREDTV